MTINVVMPNEEEDGLDTLSKVVQIGSSVYDVSKSMKSAKKTGAAQRRLERLSQKQSMGTEGDMGGY